MAGFEILKDLAAKRGADDILDSALAGIKEDRRGKLWRLLKKPSNFLKHADRVHDHALKFPVELSEGFIVLSISLYEALGNKPTRRMEVFLGLIVMLRTDDFQESWIRNKVRELQLLDEVVLGRQLTKQELLDEACRVLRNEGIEI